MTKTPQQKLKKLFSQRLRAHRMLAGYETAREFAREISEQENTYTRWERGEALPGIEQLIRVSWKLDITPNELIWPKLKGDQTLADELMNQMGIE